MSVGLAAQNENLTEWLQSLRERITTSNSDDSNETIGDLSWNAQMIIGRCENTFSMAISNSEYASQAPKAYSSLNFNNNMENVKTMDLYLNLCKALALEP
jgi:hypothetical protein